MKAEAKRINPFFIVASGCYVCFGPTEQNDLSESVKMYRWCFTAVFLILLAIKPTTPLFAESAFQFGSVSTTELHLRSLPSIEGAPITRLKSGAIVVILSELGGWYRVRELANRQEGWVNSKFISVSTNTRQAPRLPDPLSVSIADFSCDEGLFDGDGYRGCIVELAVSIEVPTIYAAFLKDTIELRCSSTVKYSAKDDFIKRSSYADQFVYFSIHNGSGYDAVVLEHSFGLSLEPIVSARLEEATCDLF